MNRYYRVYNPQTGTTTTNTTGSQACNPGHPSPIPGQLYPQTDGVPRCPTVDQCILTTTCSDNLSPVAGIYPDLRACWCNYTEVCY